MNTVYSISGRDSGLPEWFDSVGNIVLGSAITSFLCDRLQEVVKYSLKVDPL